MSCRVYVCQRCKKEKTQSSVGRTRKFCPECLNKKVECLCGCGEVLISGHNGGKYKYGHYMSHMKSLGKFDGQWAGNGNPRVVHSEAYLLGREQAQIRIEIEYVCQDCLEVFVWPSSKYGVRRRFCDNCLKRHQDDSTYRFLFGITLEEYEWYYQEQGGVCAICQRSEPTGKRLCVDHDHNTGRVRGLLCTGCNVGLGNFSDSILKLKSAIFYLQLNNTEDIYQTLLLKMTTTAGLWGREEEKSEELKVGFKNI